MAKKKSKQIKVRRVFRRRVLSKHFGKKMLHCLSKENRRVRAVFDYVGLLRGVRVGTSWECDVLLKIYPKGGKPLKLIVPYEELRSFLNQRDALYCSRAYAINAIWKRIEAPKNARAPSCEAFK